MKKYFSLLLAALMCFAFVSCSDDKDTKEEDIKEEVTFTISEDLEIDTCDYISFYTTALEEGKTDGWKYSISDSGLFEVFYENTETKSTGTFGTKFESGTLILKPKKEGKAEIVFTLERENIKREEKFSLSVEKDEKNKDVLKIKAKKI